MSEARPRLRPLEPIRPLEPLRPLERLRPLQRLRPLERLRPLRPLLRLAALALPPLAVAWLSVMPPAEGDRRLPEGAAAAAALAGAVAGHLSGPGTRRLVLGTRALAGPWLAPLVLVGAHDVGAAALGAGILLGVGAAASVHLGATRRHRSRGRLGLLFAGAQGVLAIALETGLR